ncbi:hypothetical protein [Litorisediminicola beolgyonensis]|uniref:Thioredoxin-like fold domain-containing protein n=1 Tax=Litorisediminicola beolgyonensis TaxID=1173614 RepID=A0ABW3ZFF8_9RHOB
MIRTLWGAALWTAALGTTAAPLHAGALFPETEQRAAFGAELRAALIADPAPILEALNPSPVSYAEDIAEDLARLDAERAALYAPHLPRLGAQDGAVTIAFLTGPDCNDCALAETELTALLERLGLAATRIDTGDDAAAAMMARLTLDALPAYVLPDMMIRGHVPDFVLERYLTE